MVYVKESTNAGRKRRTIGIALIVGLAQGTCSSLARDGLSCLFGSICSWLSPDHLASGSDGVVDSLHGCELCLFR